MLAAYGVDTLDPRVSTRRVHVLLERLPPHARRGGEAWSIESELLAGVVDHLAMLTYVTQRAHGAKGATKPKPVKRPRQRAINDGGQAAAPNAARPVTPQNGKAGSWIEAGAALAGIPGVKTVVSDG